VVNQDPRIAPLVFDTLAAEDFATWLVTLKRRDSAELSYSALNNHRAGLFNLFRDFSKTMSKTLESELTTYFKSLKHKLALGLYWASTTFDASDLLFPGSNQYERFRKCWQRLLSDEDVAAELKRQGLTPSELGTHSMRKGSATYCSSVSTTCPSSTAVHLRAGWSLGGVQNTYLRYEATGDMHVGRTVAGLSTESYNFSTLPPHFSESDEIVQRGVRLMFPGLPQRLEFIAEYCLASLTFHHSCLTSSLSSKHPVFLTPLFQDAAMLSSLAEQIRPGDGSSDTRFRLLEGRDMPNRKLQKRLSDLRYVMSHIEKDAASKDALRPSKKLHMSSSTALIALQWIRQLHICENDVVVN
ncbi:hypothetical protein JG688_00008304, partial [Phytophthora aleatoria]